jgi:hypothetical protein
MLYASWEGAFGATTQRWAKQLVDPAFVWIPHGEMLERIAKVLGALGTVMTAAFGIYKAVYYADRNLPERLAQLLERTDDKLMGSRAPLLAAIENRRPAFATPPSSIFYVGPLNHAFKQMGLSNHATAKSSLDSALLELERQLEVSERQRRSFEEQKVAAHIFRGSIVSARTEYDVADGKDPEKGRLLAEHEFSKAIALRPKDIDALELRGRQRVLLKNHVGALEDLDKLCRLAKVAGLSVRTARAHRLVGEILSLAIRPRA